MVGETQSLFALSFERGPREHVGSEAGRCQQRHLSHATLIFISAFAVHYNTLGLFRRQATAVHGTLPKTTPMYSGAQYIGNWMDSGTLVRTSLPHFQCGGHYLEEEQQRHPLDAVIPRPN